MDTKQIKKLDFQSALAVLKKLNIKAYSERSLPILQAQIAGYYDLPEYFEYGEYEDIHRDYFRLVLVIPGTLKVVKVFNSVGYTDLVKYLHPDYYVKAAIILQYEGKVYFSTTLRELTTTRMTRFAGYLLSPTNFKEISPIDVAPDIFCTRVHDRIVKINGLAGMVLLREYQTMVDFAQKICHPGLIRDWKDALLYLISIDEDINLLYQISNYVEYLDRYNTLVIEIGRLKGQNAPLTLREVYDMINNRDSRLTHYLLPDLQRFIGINGVSHINENWTDDFLTFFTHAKKYLETNNGFTISTAPNGCKNQHDYYYNNYKSYVFIYGAPIDGICYSAEDLMGAFLVNSADDYSFRRPDKPGSIFTYEEVKKLYEMIQQQAPDIDPDFERDTEPLLDKLAPVFTRPPAELNVIKNLSSADKETFISMMDFLFQAGMYQRTWKGPGHPYIYKRSDTGGSSLEAIECAMTPMFAYIAEGQEQMSQEGKKILRRLPAINKAVPVQMSSYRLWEFLELTTKGEFCIGFGSRIMIETAYTYLKLLGVDIDGFKYSLFEADSTHR